MYRVYRTSQARNDLRGIWRKTYDKWGSQQADKYLDEINASIELLKDNPRLGKSRERLRPGYRSLHINRHIVYYRLEPSLIRIIRVLYDGMDPDLHL
jgi:toxin ParE1/3/4